MRFIRGLFSGLGLSILAILVMVFSVCAIAYSTAGNPAFIKHVPNSSGLYDSFIGSMLEFISVEILAESDDDSAPAEGEESDDVISDERAQILTDLTPTFQRALSPERLRSIVETIFDAAADWVQGDADSIEFTIDTAEIRSDLSEALADYMERRLAELPPPPPRASMKDYDPLTADYAPPQPYSRQELERIAADLAAEMPFMGEDEMTGTDLIENPEDNDALRITREAYGWGRLGVIVFACLLVAAAALAIAVSRHRPRVLRRIGHVVTPVAVLLLAAGAVLALFVAHLEIFSDPDASASREILDQDVILPVWDSLFTNLGLVVIGFGAAWAVIAIVCYIVAHVLKRRQSRPVAPEPAPQVLAPQVTAPQATAEPAGDTPSPPQAPEQPPTEEAL